MRGPVAHRKTEHLFTKFFFPGDELGMLEWINEKA